MVAQRLYDELFALPQADQEEVLERLQHHLLMNGPPQELSEDVRRILDERLADMEKNPTAVLSRDEAFRLVAERIRSR